MFTNLYINIIKLSKFVRELDKTNDRLDLLDSEDLDLEQKTDKYQ